MTRLLVLVEGQSEEIFVKRTLTPHLQNYGVFVQAPKILWTKRLASGGGHRGGVSSWLQIKRDLMALSRDSNAWITTMLDFYGLPKDFPGLDSAKTATSPESRVEALQANFAAEIPNPRFVPFLVLHEFEAWVFSEPCTVEKHFSMSKLADRLAAVVDQKGGPEKINYGPATHPKARLRELILNYKETSDGPTLLDKIGVDKIRALCPHFHCWLSTLEALGQSDLSTIATQGFPQRVPSPRLK